jgi:hypothetical protein
MFVQTLFKRADPSHTALLSGDYPMEWTINQTRVAECLKEIGILPKGSKGVAKSFASFDSLLYYFTIKFYLLI